ncbi:hypothetical protein F4804DRAFT_316314 [Jackrogersella minutella]|nr:hypothetical protein F4804DRAFT_316314 [Jackrogersella minutella]
MEASIRGAVASSYALEQFGPPKFTPCTWLSGELWNNSSVLARAKEFRESNKSIRNTNDHKLQFDKADNYQLSPVICISGR